MGTGFGGPDHLTLRALRVLEEAEVVLHDAFVHPGILALARGERLPLPMEGERVLHEEAVALMARLAQGGKKVARLYTGDPWIFGRGPEEALALRRRGVELEVVPGLTSALGAPSLHGLPLVLRGVARSVALASGRDEGPLPVADTLVLLGPKDLESLRERLLERFPPETPLALLARAGLEGEMVRKGRLGDLPALGQGLPSPLLLVVGWALGSEA